MKPHFSELVPTHDKFVAVDYHPDRIHVLRLLSYSQKFDFIIEAQETAYNLFLVEHLGVEIVIRTPLDTIPDDDQEILSKVILTFFAINGLG